VFRGQSDQTMDAKGRVILPVRFREILHKKYDNAIILTKHLDTCLAAYPVVEWEEYESKLSRLTEWNSKARAFKRFFISSAEEVSVDKQGRILIPPSLKHFARLEKEIVIVGSINHFEIWNSQLFYENVHPDANFQDEDVRAICEQAGL
jgi:MraZ protein